MTAEILIMNREAIALAADSAATTRPERKQKVFTSVNKIFALSKYFPVGIMIYGSTDFMDIPWETIIKIYRSELGRKKFDTLREYADTFIGFLNNGSPLFSEGQQKKYVKWSAMSYFHSEIKNAIDKEVRSITQREGRITDTQVKQITSEVIENRYDVWTTPKMRQSVPTTHITYVLKKYRDIIDEATKEVFEKKAISVASQNRLRKIGASLFSIGASLFSKNMVDVFPVQHSGVVIAGFGQKEPFPSLRSFIVKGIANNRLIYRAQFSEEITFEKLALVQPFAQEEMVSTFMKGIDPALEGRMNEELSRIFKEYPERIVASTAKFDSTENRALLKKLQQLSNRVFTDYQKHMEKYIREKHVEPVVKVVAVLPKDELATMAESLVSLTSFKRKVTPEIETVAGPIDVAVISRGDGFVWIKRKHYFRPELNPQFFTNYYRQTEDATQ